jgi:hypothetical protein
MRHFYLDVHRTGTESCGNNTLATPNTTALAMLFVDPYLHRVQEAEAGSMYWHQAGMVQRRSGRARTFLNEYHTALEKDELVGKTTNGEGSDKTLYNCDARCLVRKHVR